MKEGPLNEYESVNSIIMYICLHNIIMLPLITPRFCISVLFIYEEPSKNSY